VRAESIINHNGVIGNTTEEIHKGLEMRDRVNKTCILNGTVITPYQMIKNGTVIFEDGKITAVGRRVHIEVPTEARIIDASRKIVTPGFIDIHIHGGKGRSVLDASAEAVNELAKFEADHGTTAFLPTQSRHPKKSF
jgi:N-acetylglucosamine-6-phosphate deacetylase